MIKKKEYQELLDYVEDYWNKLIIKNGKDENVKIGLPYEFVQPNNKLFEGDMFYWDSYFVILGLAVNPKRKKLIKNIADNLLYLFKRFNIIPARNRFYDLGHSQTPFLTSIAREVYNVHKDKKWLRSAARIAHLEYDLVWHSEERLVEHIGLSHHWDNFYLHATAEHESGWDMTSRFNEKCMDILPVDLNCCLFQYETDMAKISTVLNDKVSKERWLDLANARKERINKYMWNERRGFYFDYNFKTEKKMRMRTIAGFYPMWCKLATPKQAKAMVKNLKYLEFSGGLTNTEKFSKEYKHKQWDWPNGFPNLQWIVIYGLLNYGYRAEAEQIAKKWLDLNKKIFDITGKLWEKYDVVHREIGKDGSYLTQSGFAWTNAVVVKMLDKLGK